MVDKSKSQKRGRPSAFKPEYIELAHKFALLGATDVRMAEFFGVAIGTFDGWKRQYPEFTKALNEGKIQADLEVSQSLYRKALGYSHPDVDIRTVSLGDNMGSEIVQTPYVKHYPPDTTACIFWLKNRQKETWRDVVKQEVSGPDGAPIVIPSTIQIVAGPIDVKPAEPTNPRNDGSSTDTA